MCAAGDSVILMLMLRALLTSTEGVPQSTVHRNEYTRRKCEIEICSAERLEKLVNLSLTGCCLHELFSGMLQEWLPWSFEQVNQWVSCWMQDNHANEFDGEYVNGGWVSGSKDNPSLTSKWIFNEERLGLSWSKSVMVNGVTCMEVDIHNELKQDKRLMS